MKNVLVLIPKLRGIGGMETVLNEWIDYFGSTKSKFEVSFVAPQGIENIERMHTGKRVFIKEPLKCLNFNRVCGLLDVLKLLVFGKFSIVICMSVPLLKTCVLVKRIFKKDFKIVSWFHFSLNRIIKGADEPYLMSCDFHLAISSGISDFLIQRKIPKEQIAIVYNPSGSISDDHTRETYFQNRSQSSLELAYIGRVLWHGQKNLEFLLSGMNRFQLPWHLSIIGTGSRKDSLRLEQYLEDNHLKPCVSIEGWQARPFDLVTDRSDFVVLTSEYEGLPMVLIEAIRRGIPVISSDCPDGTKDVVRPNNGFLYKTGNKDDFDKVLSKAFYHKNDFNEDLIRKSGQKFENVQYFTRIDEALKKIAEVR